MNQAMFNSMMIALFGALLGIITTWFWKSRDIAIKKADAIALEHAKTISRITDLEQKLALVNQAVIPISTAFQAILIKELTHYHTPEMDALLTKIGPPNVLTEDEAKRLAELLEERTRDMGPLISESERDAASILPCVMTRAKAEADMLATAEELKLKLVNVAAVLGLPARLPQDDENSSAESLKKIEENTASTADSLAALNKRAVDKLATGTAKKSKDVD